MKRHLKLLLICLLTLVLAAVPGSYYAEARRPECRFVTQAEVTLRRGSDAQYYAYTRPDKIGAVLNYLRTTETYGNAQADPEAVGGDSYHILLRFSDGTTGEYRQSGYRYFAKKDEPWQNIESAHAHLLYPLLHLLPTDL